MQEEIIELLKREDKKLTSAEIAILLGESIKYVRMSLQKLIRFREVLSDNLDIFEIKKHYESSKIYNCKDIRRPARVYYINKRRYGI